MRKKEYRYFVGDFETTVYKGQVNTEVWASALVELDTEDVAIFHSIDETFEFLRTLSGNICVYYHNLKFDGSFWLSYFLVDKGFQQAFDKVGENNYVPQLDREMKNNTFKYTISDMGAWYTMSIKVDDRYIEFRDSLKLLPFSVKRIGESFGTKHKKLDMEYTGLRYAGCPITPEEEKYIANDVLVIKEALEIMFKEGHKKLTIGSCCLDEFHLTHPKSEYDDLFPDLTTIYIDPELYGTTNADKYIRKSYKGGWCYLAKGKEGKVRHNGTTADVNSLYPSMMHSESGNRYPVGKPEFWKGDYIPDEALQENRYFFIRIKTRFYIKENKLPFIQLKSNLLYKGTECLETSDVYNYNTGEYMWLYKDQDGKLKDTRVEMTMTCTDYKLFREHYDVVDFEILDGCYFKARIGIFDDYIDKYKEMKLKNKGALRELAKLFLNNLYGKMASSTESSFKVAYIKEDKSIGLEIIHAENKKAGYIAVGSAITSYARNFTIRAAQANYYGVDKPGFIYADTDSIHCDLSPENINGIKVHDKNFCCWKLESCWDEAIFTRQKTYIEHVTHENLQPLENPYYNVKCAGMPDRAKDYFVHSMQGTFRKPTEQWTDKEKEYYNKLDETMQEWIKVPRTIEDFKIGLSIPEGKLLPKRILGGVLLVETSYEMR